MACNRSSVFLRGVDTFDSLTRFDFLFAFLWLYVNDLALLHWLNRKWFFLFIEVIGFLGDRHHISGCEIVPVRFKLWVSLWVFFRTFADSSFFLLYFFELFLFWCFTRRTFLSVYRLDFLSWLQIDNLRSLDRTFIGTY